MLKKLQRISFWGMASFFAAAVSAQTFPGTPVTLVIPFPPGGGTDTGGRILAEQLSKRWRQTPYRGGGPPIADLLAGQVQLSFMTVFQQTSAAS